MIEIGIERAETKVIVRFLKKITTYIEVVIFFYSEFSFLLTINEIF